MYYYMCIYVYNWYSNEYRIYSVGWVLSTLIRKLKRSMKNELKLFPFVFNSR